MDTHRVVISSEPSLGVDEVANRTFTTSFRGYDPNDVRSYLRRVADELAASRERERELRARVDELKRRPVEPVAIDEAAMTAALGEEAGRVLLAAREAAADITAKAEHKVGRLVREAQEEASRLRAEAEEVLGRRIAEAEDVAAGIRRAAESDAEALRTRAHADAEAELEAARERGRQMVAEAQALRERMLGDLARKRRLAQAQVETLRAGRERLLESYKAVRRTLEEVTAELGAADTEARAAAEAAGRRAAADAELSVEELERELASPEAAASPSAVPAPAPPQDAGAAPAAITHPAPVGSEPATPAPAATTPERTTPEWSTPAPAARAPEWTTGARTTPGRAPAVPATAGDSAGEGERAPRPGRGTKPPVVPVTPKTPIVEERRSSALRVVRLPRDGGDVELPVVEPPAADEGVRVVAAATTAEAEAVPVLRAVPPAEPVEPAPVASTSAPRRDAEREGDDGLAPAAAAPPAGDVAEVAAPAGATQPGDAAPRPAVEELFARLRADREDAVAHARDVLAQDGPDDAAAAVTVAAAVGSQPDRTTPPPAATAEGQDEPLTTDPDESLLQRRDELLEPVDAALVRRLKRALQDDQNTVLDGLRKVKGRADVAAVAGTREEHLDRYVRTAGALLVQAAEAGVLFATGAAGAPPDVSDVATALAEELCDALRDRLGRALSGSDDEGDPTEAVNAAYREWKLQRIEPIARHGASAAFNRGVWAATPEGAVLRWVVDDDGRPCPDCDDDALAGPTPRGDAFPTGQLHPPAHTGCRCVLVSAAP